MAYRHENLVVCGIDGSEASFNALEWAAQEAKVRGAHLDVICCYERPGYSPGDAQPSGHLLEAGAQKILEKAVEQVKDVVLDYATHLSPEDPTSELLERSKSAARIVLGARGGSGGFADRLLGSVATAVSSRSYCSVVIIPSGPVNEVLPVKHIVCGVDGSESSIVALNLAVREAVRWGARLSCVGAVSFAGSAWLPGGGYHQEVLDDVRAGLKEAVEGARQGYDLDVRCHAIEGNPAALMTEFSTAVDLLVVGSRGRGGFAGLLLGSTSQSIIQHAACPVVVVPRRTRHNEDLGGPAVPWSRKP
ncbi:universal stress protein [Ancrocorticia populi]|uniref:universal stress protein n=1 Tax=Ancrocorticia populi TaxID=2175228 RepID=UPI003F92B1F0